MAYAEFIDNLRLLIDSARSLASAKETLEEMEELRRPGKVILWKGRIDFYEHCVEEYKNKVIDEYIDKNGQKES